MTGSTLNQALEKEPGNDSTQLPSSTDPGISSQPGKNKLFAGIWDRIVAHIIDEIIIHISFFLIVLMYFFIFDSYSRETGIVLVICSLVYSWAYYTFQESGSAMATLGKRGAGIIVVDKNLTKISPMQASARWIVKAIPVINLISYVCILIDGKNQGLHDKAAGTFVIYLKEKSQALP